MKVVKMQDELQAEASKHDLGVRYDVDVVAARCATMEPRPARTECGVSSPTQARELWAALHHAVDGGD